MELGCFYADNSHKNNNYQKIVPLEIGLKLTVNKEFLETLELNEYIKSNFKLNIKRLNRWYWSIYFDEKHDKR